MIIFVPSWQNFMDNPGQVDFTFSGTWNESSPIATAITLPETVNTAAVILTVEIVFL